MPSIYNHSTGTMTHIPFQKNILTWMIIGILPLVIFTGCKKEKKDYAFNPERQFTPGDITIKTGETFATLTWNASLFAGANAAYTVEISTDSLFAGPLLTSVVTSKPEATITDSLLAIKTNYYARVKANAANTSAASYWIRSSRFQISGEQILFLVLDLDIADKMVTLKWRATAGVTKITLTPATGAPIETPLIAPDVTAAQKQIIGLTPLTQYEAKIYKGSIQKGVITFTTKELNIFTVKLKPGDDLVAAVIAAKSGDVIGLEPGTYDPKNALGEYAALRIEQKAITIASVSKTPANTQVNFREITLAGNGAGVVLRGIRFDGLAAGANSLYFLNFVGFASDAEAATFANVEVDNCLVGNFGNCLVRANRAANHAHKIDNIKISNSLVYDNRTLNAYTFFTLDKMEFKKLELVNSTFYKIGRAFIGWSTNITVPTAPKIIIDQCTINGFGRDVRANFFLDCNANMVDYDISNSIISNSPMTGQTTGLTLVRATGAVSALMRNCNIFGLSDGAATPTALTFPATITQSSITSIDLGWTAASSSFTLPAVTPLRNASTTGGIIGDRRWGN